MTQDLGDAASGPGCQPSASAGQPSPQSGIPIAVETLRGWCIWTKTGHRPRVWHDSLEKAEAEAERLARTNPGKSFLVFEKVAKFRTAVIHEG